MEDPNLRQPGVKGGCQYFQFPTEGGSVNSDGSISYHTVTPMRRLVCAASKCTPGGRGSQISEILFSTEIPPESIETRSSLEGNGNSESIQPPLPPVQPPLPPVQPPLPPAATIEKEPVKTRNDGREFFLWFFHFILILWFSRLSGTRSCTL